MMRSTPLLGTVELGGTKCVCLIGTGPDDVRMRISVPPGLASLSGPLGALALAADAI
jgi:fructokinase